METRRKKLIYRAHHRGFKEADILIGRFADAETAHMTDDELEVFERLLDVDDHTLYGWALEREPVAAEFDTDLMKRLQAFRFQIAGG